MVLSQQTKIDAAKSEIIDRKFNKNFEKLQSELPVAKQVNSVLSGRLALPEKSPYSELFVPRSVSDGGLKEKVLKIIEKAGCPMEGNNIEACHWIRKKMKG